MHTLYTYIHIFSIGTTLRWRGGKGPTPFSGLLHFTLDMYLMLLSVKQGGIKYHFLNLWYDSTLDWTPVSLAIVEINIFIYFQAFFRQSVPTLQEWFTNEEHTNSVTKTTLTCYTDIVNPCGKLWSLIKMI